MNKHNIGSLLMISLHGYVAGSPELGKPECPAVSLEAPDSYTRFLPASCDIEGEKVGGDTRSQQ